MQQIHPQQGQVGGGQVGGQAQGQGQGQAQGQAQGRTYQNVTPLASLGRSAAPVDCPACGQRSMTRISFLAGNYTQ
jgi:lipopolysaccharide-induced tumor necrosis factor-alpha factor